MAFRMAIGQFSHETNTFCRGLTEVEHFQESLWVSGSEIVERFRGTRTYLGGILDGAREHGATVLPTFACAAVPSGTISRDCFATIKRTLLDSLRATLPVDAVCLALHGAGVAEGAEDAEGDTLRDVRALVGPKVPIAVTLDLHGNITPTMAQQADGLFGVNFYPHTDMYERGVEAVAFLTRMLKGEVRPAMHLESLDMLTTTFGTGLPAMIEVNERCWEWERKPGVIDCTFFHGFSHTDIRPMGSTVVAIANGDVELARQAARDVAAHVWTNREKFRLRQPAPEEALRQALESPGGPIVINDTSDNPGGGGPGDGTRLLGPMLAMNLPGEVERREPGAYQAAACFAHIWDPEAAAAAQAAGVGATIRLRLGGKYDDRHGAPLAVTALVKCLSDGRFVRQSPMGRGMHVNLGKMARLVIGGMDVLVGSLRGQTLDAEVYLLHGIDVARYKIVALKSSHHFRAGLEPIAKRIINADDDGLSQLDLTRFPYRNVRRPIWPLDPL